MREVVQERADILPVGAVEVPTGGVCVYVQMTKDVTLSDQEVVGYLKE
jgi:hypothetical protein